MAEDQERHVEIVVQPLLGVNTAQAPSFLQKGQWRAMKNAYQRVIESHTQRPGTIPVTGTALASAAETLTLYRANDKIIASSGTNLYKYDTVTGEWVALTGLLNQADIYDVDFTDGNTVSRKIIADKGNLKAYNDSTETVAEITAAASDPAPAPPNNLAAVNAKHPRYVWSYQSHVFIAFEKSDEVWYTKRFTNDYVPSVQYERWVQSDDYVNGCGVPFDNVQLIPMRRRWGVMTGSTFDDFRGNLFLNTPNGVIAPRSIARITYPNGDQTIAYLSDDGAQEIYDTGFQDTGSRRYSTRSLMRDKIDFDAIGLTDAEKKAAVGYFDAEWSLYLLAFKRGAERLVYAYDTRNSEWYPWDNIKASGFVRVGETVYYAGETKHLHKFDAELNSDWNEKAKTTGTEIDWDNITDLIALEDTGYASYLDYLTIMAKQFPVKSSIDVYVRTFASTNAYLQAVKGEIMVWGGGAWGEALWFNADFTDLAGKPVRIPIKKKSPYFQIRFRNDRDEPVELYKIKLNGRVSGN